MIIKYKPYIIGDLELIKQVKNDSLDDYLRGIIYVCHEIFFDKVKLLDDNEKEMKIDVAYEDNFEFNNGISLVLKLTDYIMKNMN